MTARGVAIGVGLSLLALAASFSAGRFSAPAVVATAVVVHVAQVVKEKKVFLKSKAEIVWRDRVIAKDGTVTEHEVEKSNTEVSVDKDRSTTTASDSSSTKTVTLRPSWRVSLQLGASWPKPLLPIAGPLVLGTSAEYRIAGGWSAGVWLNTYGAGGLVTSLEF